MIMQQSHKLESVLLDAEFVFRSCVSWMYLGRVDGFPNFRDVVVYVELNWTVAEVV